MRYRKSFKISSGIRMNLSKSGVSWTFGGKGASISVGKRGTYLNTSIPGTGIYNRTKISATKKNNPSANKQVIHTIIEYTVNVSDSGDIAITWKGTDQAITDASILRKIKQSEQYKEIVKNEMSELADRICSKSKEISEIYGYTPKVLSLDEFNNALASLKPATYERQIYTISPVTKEQIALKLEIEASQKSFSINPLKNRRLRKEYIDENIELEYQKELSRWEKEKEAFDAHERKIEAAENEKLLREYENNIVLINNALAGDNGFVEGTIDQWLGNLALPVECSCQYEYSKDNGSIFLDIDLPEIEDIPKFKAQQNSNGMVKPKNKTKKELNEEYLNAVIGLSIYVSGNVFNISPIIRTITLSGYTQRRNKKTGALQDDYVFSVIFDRKAFEGLDVNTLKPIDFFHSFENRILLDQSMNMKTIQPFNK